jgi:hypothetical protein
VTTAPSDELADYLRALAAGLTKCGIPVQLRTDADHRSYLRASHPAMPLSTDVYCVRADSGPWSFLSEWGSVIASADDQVSAIGYVVRLLQLPILAKLRCCPQCAGHLAKAIHVLQNREAGS